MIELIVALNLVIFSVATSEMLDPRFTLDYFREREIRQMVVFACWNESDVVDYTKRIIDADNRISYRWVGEQDLNLKGIMKVDYYKLGVVLDMDCPLSESIFDQFSAARLPYNDSYHWLSATTSSEIPVAILEKLPLTVETEFTLVLTQNKSNYSLYDVYNHSYRHGGKLNVTSMGYWSEADGLRNKLTQYKYKRRQDFHGLTLNFSMVLTKKPEPDLETYINQPINPHLDPMTRFTYHLVLALRDIYNFKINLHQTNSWGYKINGTYDGILGQMVQGIVDISATPFYYITERMNVCEYTVETWIVQMWVFFRNPRKSNVRNPFFKPLEQDVWWVALAVGLLFWMLLLLCAKLQDYFVCKAENRRKLYEEPISETALITLAATAQQGMSDTPDFYSGRMIYLTLFVWASLMYQFYSASIVGSLLSEPPRFINNLYDLANSDLHFALEDMPYNRNYMDVSSRPEIRYLVEKKHESKRSNYVSAQEGLHEVSKGGYALDIDSATAYKIIEDTFTQEQICDLVELEIIEPQYVSIVTSKHSPFKKMVNYGLRIIVERGIRDRLLRIWRHRRPNCPENFRSTPVPVELREFSPAVMMIAAAIVLAVTFMIGEQMKIHARRRKWKSVMMTSGEDGDDGMVEVRSVSGSLKTMEEELVDGEEE